MNDFFNGFTLDNPDFGNVAFTRQMNEPMINGGIVPDYRSLGGGFDIGGQGYKPDLAGALSSPQQQQGFDFDKLMAALAASGDQGMGQQPQMPNAQVIPASGAGMQGGVQMAQNPYAPTYQVGGNQGNKEILSLLGMI